MCKEPLCRITNEQLIRKPGTSSQNLRAARYNDAEWTNPNARSRCGFFEREQFERILAHLPSAIRPAVQFGYITGWRIPSEVLKLQWRHVDFEACVVRLDPHTTKNDEGRTFPFTDALERLLEAQKAEHERLKAEGVICPWVFNRSNRKVKGKRNHDVHQGLQGRVYEGGLSGSNSARPAADRRT